MHFTPQATPRLLDHAALHAMHAAALDILARTGIVVEHSEVRAAIARRAGFTLNSGRVRIAPEKVEAWRADHARRQAAMAATAPAAPSRPFTCSVSNRPPFIVECDGRTTRPMRRADVIEWTKLVTVLHGRGVTGTTPGVPSDVPVEWQPIEQYLIAARYSPHGGATAQTADIRTAGVIREMDRVYGREHGQSVWCPSPLVFGGPELDILWHFRADTTHGCVGSMPILGVTGPCDPIALFTLALAECLGGVAILFELLPHIATVIRPHPEPADMRTGNIVFGTPEWELLDVMHRDVHGFYGEPWPHKSLLTSAPVPNQQAVAEHAASAMAGMLMGFRHFGPVGQLSLDELFSPALLILDLDILGHSARVAAGIGTGDGLELATLPDIVDEVIRDGMLFAEHPTTAVNLRTQYWQPNVFIRTAMRQWLAAGRPDLLQAAQAEADRLVGEFAYEPPADILAELTRIAEHARAGM